MAITRPLKQAEAPDQIETLFGAEVTATASPRVRCADCGWLEDANQMWFVPKGTHHLFSDTRAMCRECRDARLAATAAGRR